MIITNTILWILYLVVCIIEYRSPENTPAINRMVRIATCLLNGIILILYVYNLLGNFNIQNILVTFSVLVILVLCLGLMPNAHKRGKAGRFKQLWTIKLALVALNTAAMIAHLVIFVI